MPEELAGERVDRVLAALVPEMSRTLARRVIDQGGVLLSGRRCRVASRALDAGERVMVTWHPKVLDPPMWPLRAIHSDDRVVILSKPAGQHVQGTELGDRGTLVREVARAYGPDARVVHRLDAPASGAIAVGLDARAVNELGHQVREHTMQRGYLAVTAGTPPEGRCTLRLRQHGRLMRVAGPDEDGMDAATHVSVLHSWQGRSLVALRLETGRTHQVRVHLAGLGSPLIGDPRYGGPPASRLCLHASRLAFVHPDGQPICAEDPPGEDFWDAAGLAAPPDVMARLAQSFPSAGPIG
ncbi:MAG: RluA family pseudouridine synthase [Deltaproteobacteria bacterium]|nr:RluA family pseudouridine synthase [Deltaproteobacteria bacterium]